MENSSIFYTLVPSNPPPQRPWLTLLHGFSHNHHYFDSQVAAFRSGYNLLLPDLRGHGAAGGVPGPFGVEEYTDDLVAALDQAGVERTIYWGTHTGAAVGLLLALRHPERVSALILEGAFVPGFDMPRVPQLLNRARDIARQSGLTAALEDWFENADWFAAIHRRPQACRLAEHQALAAAFNGAPWLSEAAPRPATPAAQLLERVAQPVLVYNGAEDLPDFLRAAAHLEQHLPHARRVILAEAGAFPGWENPAAVNALAAEFLQSL